MGSNTGQVLTDVRRHVKHPALKWMAANLDGRVEGSGTVFEAKFMLPWSFSEEGAAEKYMPQLQHNMWVVAAKSAVLSVTTGGSKWVEITAHADPLYQHLIVTAERKFWRCVESGDTATPRRMGAALTYARRYALFTLVGIAGEDDLDAPVLASPQQQSPGPEIPKGNGALNGSQLHAPYPAPGRSTAKVRLIPREPALDPDASAELRERPLGELNLLASGDDAAIWAHRSLPQKNRLITVDAQRVEQAF